MNYFNFNFYNTFNFNNNVIVFAFEVAITGLTKKNQIIKGGETPMAAMLHKQNSREKCKEDTEKRK